MKVIDDNVSRKDKYCLLFIIAVASALRLVGLQQKCLYCDEGWTLCMARSTVRGLLEGCRNSDNMPFHPLLTKVFVHFKDTDFLLRLPSAILGILAVIIVYQLGKLLFNQRAGLLSAFLLSISPLAVLYSRFARMYSLLPFLSLVSMFAFYRIIAEPGKRKSLFYLLILANAVGVYSQFFFWILVLFENLVVLFLWLKKTFALKRWVISQLIFILLYLPWLPNVPGQVSFVTPFRHYLKEFPFAVQLGYVFLNFLLGDTVNPWIFPITIPCSLLFLGILVLVWIRRSPYRFAVNTILALLLFVSLPSLIFVPTVTGKHLGMVLPFFLLLIGYGLTRIDRARLRWCALILITMFSSYSLYNYYTNQQLRDLEMALPWKEIAGHIERNSRENDVIVFNNVYCTFSDMFPRYYKGKLKIVALKSEGTESLTREQVADELEKISAAHERMWIVLHYYAGPHFLLGTEGYSGTSPAGAEMATVKEYIREKHAIAVSQSFLPNEHVIRGWKEGDIHKYKYNVIEFYLCERF